MDQCLPTAATPWWVGAAIISTWLGALVFVVAYANLAPWKSTPMGKHVMTFMAVILAVTSLAVISVFFGNEWPYRSQIRMVCWGAVAAVIWMRIWLLIQAQRGRDISHPQSPPETVPPGATAPH